MIKWEDAVRVARSLLGTPYAELDCINLIKKVIRTAPGGVPGYTTAGTNSLWKSIGMSAKYRDVVWQQEGITAARAGMLAFKRRGSDVHHVGLVTDCGTVIHASSASGCAVETPLTEQEGWTLLAIHRYVGVGEDASGAPQEHSTSPAGGTQQITIIDSKDNVFIPVGDFRVLFDSVD